MSAGVYRESSPPAEPERVSGREFATADAVVAHAEWLLWPDGIGLGATVLVVSTPAVIWTGVVAPMRSGRAASIGLLLAALALRLAWQPCAGALPLAALRTFAPVVGG